MNLDKFQSDFEMISSRYPLTKSDFIEILQMTVELGTDLNEKIALMGDTLEDLQPSQSFEFTPAERSALEASFAAAFSKLKLNLSYNS